MTRLNFILLLGILSIPAPGQDEASDEVLSLDRAIDAALLNEDSDFLDEALSDDFRFTHGDAWTRGEEPRRVDDKRSTLRLDGRFISRTLDSQKVELHGSIAITTGRIRVRRDGGRRKYSLWYLRVYHKRDRRWKLVSHRTVRFIVDE